MTSILLRWLAAFILVAATYNPTKINFVVWATDSWQAQTPLVVLIGIVLLIGYAIYLRATFRSIGFIGIGLVAALAAALIWVLMDFGVISLDNPGVLTWIGLIVVSFVLGIGLSWSLIRRRLSGQADVDDVDES